MAHVAKVEVAIHDANPQTKKKKQNYSSSGRPKSAGGHRSSGGLPSYLKDYGFYPLDGKGKDETVGRFQAKGGAELSQLPAPHVSAVPESALPGSGTGVFGKDLRVSPERRKQQHDSLNLSGSVPGGHRSNPLKKVPPPWEGFRFSAKPPDRDELRTQQDLHIQSFRLRHPELYEPDPGKAPTLDRAMCHHDSAEHFTPRDRTMPRSNAANLHNPLPHYPFLRAKSDHGIHQDRWNVMTIPSDDPERLIPATSRVTTSHDDFSRFYNSSERALQRTRRHSIDINMDIANAER